ncbi:MAG: DUF4340 domain-containing protein [Ruminococcaceae bacterium]|nr:DUF4340 domain-containing protein [Oscillospiraceae bacterium]
MTNIPENEPIKNEAEGQEEFSTIFSNPQEHKEKSEASSAGKKRIKAIIAAALAVAVLAGGTFAAIKLIPDPEEPEVNTGVEEIEVLSLKEEDIETVTVKNSKGSFELYVKEKTGFSSSSSTSSYDWYLRNYNEKFINTSSVSTVANSAIAIKASREIDKKTATQCGLDKPSLEIEINQLSGEKFSVLLGDESPDNSGYYLKLSNSSKIYLVGSDFKEKFEFEALDMAVAEAMSGFPMENVLSEYKDADGEIYMFDNITITGKNFAKPMVFQMNEDTRISTYVPFLITSPIKRAGGEAINTIYNIYNVGISAVGAYSFDVKANTLKKFGLDNPDFKMTMKIGKQTFSYSFKMQEDGYYAAVCDTDEFVKKVAPTDVSFVEFTPTSFYSSWVCMNPIDDVDKFIFKTPEATYEFTIAPQTDENSDEDYYITCNGKKLDSENFQNFYGLCAMLNCSEYNVDNLKTNADYTIEFIFKESVGGTNKVEFVKASETRYECRVDGESIGKLTSAPIKKLAKYVAKVAANETIVVD